MTIQTTYTDAQICADEIQAEVGDRLNAQLEAIAAGDTELARRLDVEIDMLEEALQVVVDTHGRAIDFGAAVMLMDDDLREEIADEGCDTDQEFLIAYAARHESRFGEEFVPFAGGAW